MDMQDKDLDKLFQSALDGYEIEPSAKVWSGITEELNAGKRKRSLAPFLSVAAGVILLATAGLLFIPKEVKVTKSKADRVAAVKQSLKPAAPVAETIADVQPIAQQNKKNGVAVIAPVNSLAGVKIYKAHRKPVIEKTITAGPAQTQDIVKQNDQPVLASATHKQEVIKPVVPDTATKIMAKHIEEVPVFASTPQVIPTQVATANKQAPAKKHKIRSLGDVFNVMIAAVDKRKDKIIEFSNTDGDDATITGVNLGIIKVKKEK
jgi:hypothetical protein